MVRLLTVGSVPPELGGTTTGGVAKVHALLIDHWVNSNDCSDFCLAGVVASNRPPDDDDDVPETIPLVHLPRESVRQQESYLRTLEERHIDAVLFHHIGHRFVDWHVKGAVHIPAIGFIHSWTQVLIDDVVARNAKRERLQWHLSQMKWLTAPSDYTFEQGRALGFEYASPCEVIYNAIDPAITHKAEKAQEGRYERRGIAFVGTLNALKRPAFVIRAAAAVGLPLVMVGDGPQRAELEELAQTVRDKTAIRFEGQQSPERIADILLSSQMLCVPSTSEGLANVYWEALACGTPVVGYAPNVAELARVLDLHVGEPVSGDADVYQVIQAVERVRNRLWKREELKLRAAQWTSVHVCAQRHADVVRKAVEATRSSRSGDR
jgi:glycosyltransferase involved in cell wall biosynthesis